MQAGVEKGNNYLFPYWTKEECVNHVAKRMGTALRNLSTQGKKKDVTLGGRGYGKLTQAVITTFTGYFGKAIRAHPMTSD